MPTSELLYSMLRSYVFTILLETAVLLLTLSAVHGIGRRLFAGVWLTACTYPLLWLVLPKFIDPDTQRALYLTVGESLVPVAECALFWLAFQRRRAYSSAILWRDWTAIILANLVSFGVGELVGSL